jgi:sperm-associated antigen 1
MGDSDQTVHKRTLLQKYEIPIEFLDFSYIKNCSDVKLLEKIVKILRSGEEGFYPDLTKCAEEKLKSLMPDSKMFRIEEPAVKKENLNEEKRNKIDDEMKSWINDMKKQDQLVMEIKPVTKPEPPIRKAHKKIDHSTESVTNQAERIKSTDYAKWEKFDAEAAELKIDLDEERQREIVEVKNKKNVEKTKLIEEIGDVEVDCLSDFEKDHLSLKFKEKGNECYKANEYDEAIKEYTQSLRLKKSAAAFNNRALICKL